MDEIVLRKAIFSDAEKVFDWRNAPETRQYFFNPAPLNKPEHLAWFNESLIMSTRCLLIAEVNNHPIGVLRYDLKEHKAEIDIYICPEISGKGWGTKILLSGTEWIRRHYPDISVLEAQIMVKNVASMRAFEKAGFNAAVKIYRKIME